MQKIKTCAINIKDYPFKMEANNMLLNQSDRILRPGSIKLWNDNAKTKMGTESFSIVSQLVNFYFSVKLIYI